MSKRRMVGWQPLAVENASAPMVPLADIKNSTEPTVSQTAAPQAAEAPALPPETAAEPAQAQEAPVRAAAGEVPAQAVQSSGPIQDPDVPRRRMAGWTPLSVAHDGPPAVIASGTAWPQAGVAESEPVVAAETAPAQEAVPAGPTNAGPAPVTEDLPRRRMQGWQPLAVGHPDSIAPSAVEVPAGSQEPPVAEAQPAKQRMDSPTPEAAPAKQRMGAPAGSSPGAEPEVKMPDVVTPPPAQKPAATETVEKDVVRQPSKLRKALLSLLGVALVAAGVVLLAQWLRTLDPVAEFIGKYDGTPTHPDGVTAGIPGWVGWQHFFNFFIMVMVIRSGFLIRNQERPEAYWTPTEGGFYSPGTKNTPQKVSIQQWIHQSFNVLWVANGLFFYIMVFATGHWMRLVPTNWDIFPNIISAGLQYVSLDWPEENSWVYYNALQIMTYFLTVFVAAPLAVLTGLRLSTWWPQQAGINTVFSLPVARKIHFGTMVYFILFILVHLFLVFTTGVLSNLNMMFTARDASDWWGIGVFAVSVALTVGIAWLIKPIFVSPIAEKTGTVSTR